MIFNIGYVVCTFKKIGPFYLSCPIYVCRAVSSIVVPPYPWGMCSKKPQGMLETTDSTEPCVSCVFPIYTYL